MSDGQYVLVAVETAHIQPYIFASNRLKENVGASYLVAAATGQWAVNILLQDMKIKTNLTGDRDEPFNSQEIQNLDAEVLYYGGGNFVVLFADGSDQVTLDDNDENKVTKLDENSLSRRFIRGLSRKVQVEAPGLKLTFAVKPFRWSEQLSEAVSNLLNEMKSERGHQPALRGNGGLSVNIMGSSTSMPAVTMATETDEREISERNAWQPYSAETVAKRKAAEGDGKRKYENGAIKLLEDMLLRSLDDKELANNYRFALELDDLGRSEGDTSYIAVVHADGDGLGVFIQGLKERFPAEDNRKYINYMRALSQTIKDINKRAQQAMVKRLIESIDESKSPPTIAGRSDLVADIELEYYEKDKRWLLPLRPLVSGGDDVTFVCDGRIALDLLTTFIEKFKELSEQEFKKLPEKSPGLDNGLTACGGVAIVKTHYPFARAYDLADDLAGSAKQARKLREDRELDAPSAIDWHITAGSLYGDLDAMRQREYQIKIDGQDSPLNLRPVFLGGTHERTWANFQQIVTHFQTKWDTHRNKAERLRFALRQGPTEAAVFKARYLSDSKSPDLPAAGGIAENGWKKIADDLGDERHFCGYYDALELMDKYIPLDKPNKKKGVTS